MKFIKLKWHNGIHIYLINIDKIISIELKEEEKRITICTQENYSYYIKDENKNKLQEIYKDILNFCISSSNPNEIEYAPLLEINI